MKSLLVIFGLVVALSPVGALAAERDGTALFFSFEELSQMLRHPTSPQFDPRSALQPQGEEAGHEGRIEREYRWGNGLGINSYAYPSTHRPLWGY